MIYIKENQVEQNTVEIRVDGILDGDALLPIEKVLGKALSSKKTVSLELRGITRADRDGINFLKKYKGKIIMNGMSEFLKMEINDEDGRL